MGGIMELFQELRTVALRQNQEADLPCQLLEQALAIADDPQRFVDKIELVGLLISQIADFDCYAGAGCFDSSVSAETIGKTVRSITG